MTIPYVGTTAYLIPLKDARNLVLNIRDIHSEFPVSEFPENRPGDNDDSLGACLYWERDLMLNASVSAEFPTRDGLVIVKARNAGIDLMQYMEHHKFIRVLERMELRAWTCPDCAEEFMRTPTESKRTDPCFECTVLTPHQQ